MPNAVVVQPYQPYVKGISKENKVAVSRQRKLMKTVRAVLIIVSLLTCLKYSDVLKSVVTSNLPPSHKGIPLTEIRPNDDSYQQQKEQQQQQQQQSTSGSFRSTSQPSHADQNAAAAATPIEQSGSVSYHRLIEQERQHSNKYSICSANTPHWVNDTKWFDLKMNIQRTRMSQENYTIAPNHKVNMFKPAVGKLEYTCPFTELVYDSYHKNDVYCTSEVDKVRLNCNLPDYDLFQNKKIVLFGDSLMEQTLVFILCDMYSKGYNIVFHGLKIEGPPDDKHEWYNSWSADIVELNSHLKLVKRYPIDHMEQIHPKAIDQFHSSDLVIMGVNNFHLPGGIHTNRDLAAVYSNFLKGMDKLFTTPVIILEPWLAHFPFDSYPKTLERWNELTQNPIPGVGKSRTKGVCDSNAGWSNNYHRFQLHDIVKSLAKSYKRYHYVHPDKVIQSLLKERSDAKRGDLIGFRDGKYHRYLDCLHSCIQPGVMDAVILQILREMRKLLYT